MPRRISRTHCAGCGVQLDDDNCYRASHPPSFRTRCKTWEAAKRRADRLAMPTAVRELCGSTEGMSRRGRPSG